MPFGTETKAGEVIPGQTKCTTGVLRCDPDGSNFELLAWGLRNAFGLHHHPDGRLFATEHGIDERGARFIIGDPDDFYEVVRGTWYGYPDYASGRRLDDPHWGDGGRGREPVIADPPGTPPEPYVSFTAHAAANGFDFSTDDRFGFVGDAFGPASATPPRSRHAASSRPVSRSSGSTWRNARLSTSPSTGSRVGPASCPTMGSSGRWTVGAGP